MCAMAPYPAVLLLPLLVYAAHAAVFLSGGRGAGWETFGTAALVAGAYAVLGRMLVALAGGSRIPAVLALALVSANPSFVFWTVSDPANALVVLLHAVLCALAARERLGAWAALAGGLVAAALALVRPEALLAALGLPLVLLAGQDPLGPDPLVRRRLLPLALYSLACLVPLAIAASCGGRVGFAVDPGATARALIFHPDAYRRFAALMECLAGRMGPALFFALLAETAWLLGRRRLGPGDAAPLVFAALAAFTFLLLPADPAPLCPRATAFFPFACAAAVVLGWRLTPAAWLEGRRTRVALAALAIFAASVIRHAPVTWELRAHPPARAAAGPGPGRRRPRSSPRPRRRTRGRSAPGSSPRRSPTSAPLAAPA
jgi:hypothetical protein